jgi:NADPH2:quinone reductase
VFFNEEEKDAAQIILLDAFKDRMTFPDLKGMLGPKGSIYLTRQTLFTHIATRESTQVMANDLFDVVSRGKVHIRIGQRYPLEEVQQAHRDLEARKTTGCTILTL